MSENSVVAALRRMGIGREEMTAHGFRAMARTLLDEMLGFRPDFIEHQLAHAVRDPQRARLQPDGLSAGTEKDDAGVGGLSGPVEGRCVSDSHPSKCLSLRWRPSWLVLRIKVGDEEARSQGRAGPDL